jgi:membrane AbrB-like protein
MNRKRIASVSGALVVCISAGLLCAWLKTPIPWMIGPLVGMAAFQFGGATLEAPPFGREAGQLTIGIALGLYFTPAVAREVAIHAPALLAVGFGVFAIGVLSSFFLARAARVDRATAFFSSAIGGAAEMVILAERHGALVDRVALAHSLRLLVVVTSVPVAITLLGQTGTDDYRPIAVPFDAVQLAMLACIALAAAFVWRRTRLPNAFMMGPLLITIALTASGAVFSSIPTWLTNAAQVLLACNLGSRFARSFLREAPRFIAAVLASVMLMILLTTLLAIALAWSMDHLPATTLLACAPGGIAEMAITAKVLKAGVAFVTAAHVMRFLIVMLVTEPAYRLYAHWRTS